MAYDEGLAQRVREAIGKQPGYEEKKMFGGIGFLIRGNMACGVIREDLIVRVGADKYTDSLLKPHVELFEEHPLHSSAHGTANKKAYGYLIHRPIFSFQRADNHHYH